MIRFSTWSEPIWLVKVRDGYEVFTIIVQGYVMNNMYESFKAYSTWSTTYEANQVVANNVWLHKLRNL